MTGAWRGGLQLANPVTYASVTATASGTTFVKGAWTQVTAATTSDSAWLQVFLSQAFATIPSGLLFDIGYGSAGSEVVVISNLICSQVGRRVSVYFLPINIIAGTRLAVRVSSSAASTGSSVQLMTFDDAFMSSGTNSAIDTYGVLTGTNLGTLVDPGATPNTKGSYAQLTASTTNDLSGFCLGFDNQTDASSGSVIIESWLVDIAVGAGGSEQILVPNLLVACFSGSFNAWIINNTTPFLPIQIPAGTRIAARAQCSTGTSPDRKLGVSLYGIRR